MSAVEPRPDSIPAAVRWYRLTPDRLVLGLLAVEGVLLLSERFRWFPFNAHKGWTVLIALASVGAILLLFLLWFGVALVFRIRFQFTIRSLLVLTVAVAVPCSWLATEMKRARGRQEIVAAAEKAGGGLVIPADMSAPACLRKLLGDDFFNDDPVVHLHEANFEGLRQLRYLHLEGPEITDAAIERIGELANLELLYITESRVTDSGLKHVATLRQVKSLMLRSNNKITDAGLEHLKGMDQLEALYLYEPQITDAGLEHIGTLKQLGILYLDLTQVTDAGFEHLRGSSHLWALGVGETKVTEEGVKKLRQALPNCDIQH